MRFRALSVRVAFIVGLACVLLLLQMVAVSRLSSSQIAHPWQEREFWDSPATLQSPLLEHEKPPDRQVELGLPDTPDIEGKDPLRKSVTRHVQQLENRTHSLSEVQNGREKEAKTKTGQKRTDSDNNNSTAAEKSKSRNSFSKNINFNFFPIPGELKNCEVSSSNKDLVSAINRATTEECKELLKNVSCSEKAGQLYNTGIERVCGTSNPAKAFHAVPLTGGTGNKARVVFLMSLHGRAFRQVKRLFKAIYHTDHYYFVHVDSRSDYLHRKLYESLSDFGNVYFPAWRMATIWGGASLLQMLLRALQDLELILTDWNWDYFINISESDYPLKTNDELVQFLKVHRGSNFVKTHGGDIKKFIQKQGLDRTFVECDNHMWRIGHRKLPQDLTIDGGSDWIAIHRNFSRYLITDRSTFLTGMKRYYEFSLLPAESFFHTILRNGPMCNTFVKTNLRITNWNRKLGCRCQYKHIVDWCGCSPNDFLIKDIGRLKAPGDHHFFGRKFEAIVSHNVIHELDTHLYGKFPDDFLSVSSYWESIFNVEDDLDFSYSAKFTVYHSFLRLGLAHLEDDVAGLSEKCGTLSQPLVKEVTVLKIWDNLKGLIVTLKDGLSESFSPPEYEMLFSPIDYVQKYTVSDAVAKRIQTMEMGTDWDGKESVFRNLGAIIGVWDEPTVALRLSSGEQGSIQIVWDDPIGERVNTETVKPDKSVSVTYHKPKFDRPLRPGVWNVRVELTDETAIMETKLLVVPLTHDKMSPLKNPVAVNAKQAKEPAQAMESLLSLEWKENVHKEGEELEGWLDDLVSEFWKLEGVCRTESSRDNCEDYVTDCSTADWSTFFPDPKSELGEVDINGRIR